MLSIIASRTLGFIATLLVALTVILVCLTTAAVLAFLFAEFISQDIFRNKFGAQEAVIIATLILSFLFRLLVLMVLDYGLEPFSK